MSTDWTFQLGRVSPPAKRQILNGATMGTRYSSVFYADCDLSMPALHAALQEAVDRVDQQMSTWKETSDLNRLNRSPIGEWCPIPRDLQTVLECALRISRQSGSLFNIAVGANVNAWGFGPNGAAGFTIVHHGAQCPAAHDVVEVCDGAARRTASINIDLSGIAKGFGVDELGRVMSSFGVRNWLVGIDGEMRAAGRKPNGEAWAVAHEKAQPGERDVMGVIELVDTAVATSGNYRKRIELDGNVYSHTIDPRTGAPVTADIASATVLHPSCMEADAWATALMVAGCTQAHDLAKRASLHAVLIRTDGNIVELTS